MTQIYGIKCDITLDSGVTLGWWIATHIGEADLLSQKGYLRMNGYLDKAAFEGGKPPVITGKNIPLNGFASIEGFVAYWQACCATLIATEFPSGTVESAVIPGTEVVNENPS